MVARAKSDAIIIKGGSYLSFEIGPVIGSFLSISTPILLW